ncbi:L-lactate permease [Alcaligenaceae bacterium SJ-26]|nr:L-lactate permease [Alcaligenaceae bacterium SJ-26]
MQAWQQVYDPAGNIWLSSLVALIPIVFFFLALTVLRLKGWVAGTITVVLALAVAVLFYQMPVGRALASGVYGFFYGLWPIAWIIVGAVFLYKVSVKTGQFDVIRESILSITEDQRLQMLLVGFSFGAFLEGAAGFGAPVAITAALLMGLGFKPLYAAGLCLIVNTAPVAFGALGIPVIVAGQVTGLDAFQIGQMAGRQLPLLTIIVLFWIMAIMDGWRGVKETWPAVLVGGGSFAIVQYLTSNFIGPELPDITSSIASLVCLTLFLKVWKPKRIFRFEHDANDTAAHSSTTQAAAATSAHAGTAAGHAAPARTVGQLVKAWSPFLILTAMVTIWSLKPFKQLFAPGGALASWVVSIPVPFLDKLVEKMPPIVTAASPYAAVYKFDWFSATGTSILIAAIISIILLRMRPKDAFCTFGETMKELKTPIYSIGMVLAFAFIANYSGLSATLALALAHTGHAFTFFSPFLGWLGVFLTGSDTSSNALFGALQAATAQQIGVSDILLVAANTTGGVTGKMISPQSIAIACAAVGLAGRESDLFRFTVKHSLCFAAMIGVITTLQAYVFPWMIPGHP